MLFIAERLAAAIATVEWSTVWDVTLGAMLALWVTHQAPQPAAAGRQVTIPVESDSGCHTTLTANGHAFPELLDSGALGLPLLFGSNQAADLGLDKESLDFSHRYVAINGEGRAAFVTLPEITVFGWTFRNVPAVITKAPQTEGLIGAEVLHRLNFSTTPGYCSVSLPVEEG